MDLFTPEAQAGAHYWASVLLAHAFLGLVLTAILGALIDWIAGDWIEGTGWLACLIVVVAYAVGWEVAAQRLGAGWADAAVDAVAVACGALSGVSAWARHRVALAASFVTLAGVAAAGVWQRTGRRGEDER